jgi:hypothetical protein
MSPQFSRASSWERPVHKPFGGGSPLGLHTRRKWSLRVGGSNAPVMPTRWTCARAEKGGRVWKENLRRSVDWIVTRCFIGGRMAKRGGFYYRADDARAGKRFCSAFQFFYDDGIMQRERVLSNGILCIRRAVLLQRIDAVSKTWHRFLLRIQRLFPLSRSYGRGIANVMSLGLGKAA